MPSNDEPPPSVWYGSASPLGPDRSAPSVGPAESKDMHKSSEFWAARTSSAIAASTIPWLIVQPVLMVLFVGATIWTGGPPATQVPVWPPTTPVSLFSIPRFARADVGSLRASGSRMAGEHRRDGVRLALLGCGNLQNPSQPASRPDAGGDGPSSELCGPGTTLYIGIAKESWPGPRPLRFTLCLFCFGSSC